MHQRDWFFFVDGVEGDRSAAEVHIHAGDVLWWDYRHWTPSTMSIPVVVGAYPHPFVDGGARASSPRMPRWRSGSHARSTVSSTRTSRTGTRSSSRAAYPANHVAIRRAGNGYVLELGIAVATKLAADEHALRYRF